MAKEQLVDQIDNTPEVLDLVGEAIEWVTGQHKEHQECPWCGWNQAAKSNPSQVFKSHLRGTHQHKAQAAYEQSTMDPTLIVTDPVDAQVPLLERIGLEVKDEWDKFNALAVPDDIRREAEAEGGVLRWVDPNKGGYWKNQGAWFPKYKPEHEDTLAAQRSTEDGTVRANEMILAVMPKELVAKRTQIKRQLNDNNLRSRAEERPGGGQGHRSDTAQKAYDSMLAQGSDKATAQQVADSVDRGLQKGNIGPKDTREDGYFHFQDQQGRRSL